MSALYNEIEPYPVEWLRNLIAAGHIAPGTVDARSIADLTPGDARARTQAHFFAGIGVWSHALRLAGWPDDCEIWSGSCPCQPFSAAGKRGGVTDERHLWPEWFRLIQECRPSVIVGEQVASPDGLGWLDAVCADLEGAGYAVGASDLCAAGVGAPHIRQRLYFVAYADGDRLEGIRLQLRERRSLARVPEASGRCEAGELVADTHGTGTQRRFSAPDRGSEWAPRESGVAGIVGHADGRDVRRVDCAQPRAQGRGGDGANGDDAALTGATRGHWYPADWISCRDGKARPVEPGTFPLAPRAANHVGRLRAYGNAITAPLAATFIKAVIDVLIGDT